MLNSFGTHFLIVSLQLFRKVAAALPGMEANEKVKEDSEYSLNFCLFCFHFALANPACFLFVIMHLPFIAIQLT